MNNKSKVWADQNGCAEEWKWNGKTVLRYKIMKTSPWTYRIGEFTKDHRRFASDGRDRTMTQSEIQEFKTSRKVR